MLSWISIDPAEVENRPGKLPLRSERLRASLMSYGLAAEAGKRDSRRRDEAQQQLRRLEGREGREAAAAWQEWWRPAVGAQESGDGRCVSRARW